MVSKHHQFGLFFELCRSASSQLEKVGLLNWTVLHVTNSIKLTSFAVLVFAWE